MKKSTFLIRNAGVAGVILLLALTLAQSAGALFVLQEITPEPTSRPTAEPVPYLMLDPEQGIAGDATPVTAGGGFWTANQQVLLFWDSTDRFLTEAQVGGDRTFRTGFLTPTELPYASVGMHTVIAMQGNLRAEASFLLIAPTPVPPTLTFTPTDTQPPPSPTFTRTPVTPSPTPSPSPTASPTPTLRPITPMVTITPIPPTKPAPVTRAPVATRTNTPVPGTPTSTYTPSITPTPSNTPGPGTPSATPQPTATPEEEISETGSGWGTIFLWGFVLAGLLIVFRLLRVRGLSGQG
jgi:hypothetical protein